MSMLGLRPDLPPLPEKMRQLPRDHRGFPIPWFVAELPDGTRDFRIASAEKKHKAVRYQLCWVCGQKLGTYKAFVIGPMCAVNRNTAEPPCHLECAHFSAIACPFLSKPRMKRNEKGLEDVGAVDPAGVFLTRNPGCTCLWVTKTFRIRPTGPDWLISLGEPTDVRWFCQSQEATRAQVLESIDSGMPALEKMAQDEGQIAIRALADQRRRINQYLPER